MIKVLIHITGLDADGIFTREGHEVETVPEISLIQLTDLIDTDLTEMLVKSIVILEE